MRDDIYVAADFGLAKIAMKQSLLKTVCGTPGYCGMCHGLDIGLRTSSAYYFVYNNRLRLEQ